jgi:histidinol-phosphate aminotransferase
MRVGYGIAHPDIVDMVQRVRPLFNVNNLAQCGAMAALKDREFVEMARTANSRERIWLSEELAQMGWRVIPSQTNFLFVDTGMETTRLVEAARAAGIIIRGGAGWGYPTFLRISLGTREQLTALLAVLTEALGKNA